ncbi:hypothetical protein PR202_gb01137 [Eleusine coracana subsp. coracana]|uniref:FAF domain-containing protein n=1 Tax=Eleusine coracana subsp. coracana TaxID=191504 RepID=A0AAV5DVG0_ELECO|nr:hypothetical protein QOZ80_5BG0421730 [Eleusine coracana subsp. coracana]GJN14326.1 hypothetical protein PR202_gb01137 [Eleusine coracana subsp. coracana]
MPALLDSPPQLPSTCGWGVLYPVVEEAVKPRHLLQVIPAAAAAKKPAAYYRGGKKKNLETCTEALGCETGGVDICDGGVDAENAERKRRAREGNEEEEMVSECQPACRGRRPLPPPLTTLAGGVNRVRMVHERRDGRLEVYAVRSPGVLEAERCDGRLRLRLRPLIGAGSDDAAMCCQQEPEDDEEDPEATETEGNEGEHGFAKYMRSGRCVDPEGGAAASSARLREQWEPEQAAAFWVATS